MNAIDVEVFLVCTDSKVMSFKLIATESTVSLRKVVSKCALDERSVHECACDGPSKNKVSSANLSLLHIFVSQISNFRAPTGQVDKSVPISQNLPRSLLMIGHAILRLGR